MRGVPADLKPGPDLRVLDGVAGWCGGLHGAMSLDEALKSLAAGLEADAAALSRHHHRNEDKPRTVALYDALHGEGAIRRAYCQVALDYLFTFARVGAAWFLSDLLDDPGWRSSAGLTAWRTHRGIAEIVVVPLAQSAQQSDFIEFHFTRPLKASERAEIEALVPTILRSWAGRKPGLVTGAAMDERFQARARVLRPAWDAPLLGMSNPAGLSRAEFRVCLLVSRGLSVRGISEELGLSDNTVRSHLRAIYAKTDTSSMAELLYRILSGSQDDALPERIARRG